MNRLPDRSITPPMSALRSFEAAARLGSFTLAASDLHVTQGAISRQVRLLEELLGVVLFDRTHQRVVLTEAGEFYFQHVSESLGLLRSATAQTASYSRPKSDLHIGIVPTFGSRWIIPRLSSFMDAHPRIQLRLSAVPAGGKFPLDDFDAALVVGREDWPNTVFHLLETEELIAVAAPGWLRAHRVRSPSDLIGPPLLIHSARANLWTKWFAVNGVDPGALVPSMLRLEQITMIIEAAMAELGAALLPRALIQRELAARELRPIRGASLHVNDGFHLVYAAHKRNDASLVAFRNWLLGLRQSV